MTDPGPGRDPVPPSPKLPDFIRPLDGALASRIIPGPVIWTRAVFDAGERQRALRTMLIP